MPVTPTTPIRIISTTWNTHTEGVHPHGNFRVGVVGVERRRRTPTRAKESLFFSDIPPEQNPRDCPILTACRADQYQSIVKHASKYMKYTHKALRKPRVVGRPGRAGSAKMFSTLACTSRTWPDVLDVLDAVGPLVNRTSANTRPLLKATRISVEMWACHRHRAAPRPTLAPHAGPRLINHCRARLMWD